MTDHMGDTKLGKKGGERRAMLMILQEEGKNHWTSPDPGKQEHAAKSLGISDCKLVTYTMSCEPH